MPEKEREKFGWLFRAMFGSARIPDIPDDEARWLDEGGAVRPGEDGYEHIIGPVRYL